MMLHRRAVLLLAAMSLLLVLIGCEKEEKTRKPVVVQAFPSAAGVCSLPATGNCMAANTCSSGGSCNIGLAINSSETVDLTLNGSALTNPHQLVCIPSGGSITWSVAASNSSFLADFGNAAPFTDNNNLTYFGGTTTQPATHAAASANGCYKYNIKVCPIPGAAGPTSLNCGQSDPKVIVGSGG